MSKTLQIIKSPHIKIALATGICILVMAYFSKRILPKPIEFLPLAIPPFLMVIFELVDGKDKKQSITKVWYWILAIFSSTALVIMLTWYEVI